MKRELIAGINALEGLLEASPERIVRVWLKPGGRRLDALGQRLAAAGVAVEHCEERTLDRRAGGLRHQGVLAECLPAPSLDEHDLTALLDSHDGPPLLLVLDQVQDPHNLGACLRTARAAGALAVIVPKDRAASLTPAARRAAAGAAEHLPLISVTNLARTLTSLADRGIWLVGLAGEAETSLFDCSLDGPLALVLGSEEKGLRRLTRERCDQLVRIPMAGDTESLNVSVAAGIALFSAVRTRRGA